MKNFLKLKPIYRIVGIIAFVAVIGFSVIACDMGMGGGGLDGDWRAPSAGYVIRIRGSSGVYRQWDSNLNSLYRSAVDRGYVKIGDEDLRNLTQTGNNTWSGQTKLISYNSYGATGTAWGNCTITLSSDGRSFQLYYSSSSGSLTYNRL